MKKITTTAVIMMLICTVSACAKPDNAAEFIYLSGSFENATITNGKSEYYRYEVDENSIYDDDEVYTGTMKVYEENSYNRYGDDSPSLYKLVVPDSEYFCIEATDKDAMLTQQMDFELNNKYNKLLAVFAEYVKRIEIKKKEAVITGEEGSDFDYYIYALIPKYNAYFRVSGMTEGSISYKYGKDNAVIKGAKGKTNIMVTDKKTKDGPDDIFCYLYGEEIKVTLKNKNISVKPAAAVIPQKKKKGVYSLYLRPANSGKNMFLSWSKVRKAKSYVIYRYDSLKGAYRKVAVRNGNSANYWSIPKADSGIVYRYKVAARSKKNGKGKKVCKMSYPVWGVAQDNAYSNVTKATTNRTTIKGKPGKKIRVKATVEEKADKRLLSKNIRWYSSNRKIAKVGRDTGKVTLMKKGKCKIWAKAHNGKNSEKIIVTVK